MDPKAEYTTIPVSIWDATVANAEIFTRTIHIFDAQLCFEKLHAAWKEILKARPIIHARLRRSDTAQSGLEYHVYTPEGLEGYLERQDNAPDRLKDFLCLDQSHRSIKDYSPAMNRRAAGAQEIFVADAPDPEDFKRCTHFNGVETLEDQLTLDRSVLTVQITRFSDATMLTFSFTHVMSDVFAIRDILVAWQDALDGKPITPWEKLEQDPFVEYGPGGKFVPENYTSNPPLLPPGWSIYGVFKTARLVSRFLWDKFYTRPEKSLSGRHIFIPDAKLDEMMKQATTDLAEIEEERKREGLSESSLELSRSNIIYAWLIKQIHAHLHHEQMSAPVSIVNARGRPPAGTEAKDFPPHNWWNGAYLAAVSGIKVDEIRKWPLGKLALHVRESIAEASTPESARRLFSFDLHYASWKNPSKKIALWAPPDHSLSGLTDWRAVQFGNADFTLARREGSGPVSTCGLHASMVLAGNQSLRDRWACLGEAGGGIWLVGMFGDAHWSHPEGFGQYEYHQRSKPMSEINSS